MHKKFKLIFLFIFILSSNIVADDKIISIALIRQKIDFNSQFDIMSKYLVDLAESKIKEKFPDYVLKDLMGDIENYDLSEIQKAANINGLTAFYFISSKIIQDSLVFNIKLFDWQGKINFEDNFPIKINKNNKLIISQDIENEWINMFYSSLDIHLKNNERKYTEKIKAKLNFKYDHDYPLFCITVSALSAKIYFDDRINSKIQKIFSLSPLEIRASFYPLRYMETGLFCRFDFNNMVYTYYDKNNNKYFDTSFILGYGLFLGASIFKENLHFSFGGQMYNLYYDIKAFPDWQKTNDINSYFLPQFAIYFKLDFKLFKYLYFTIFVNFKTLPKFELYNGYIYSKPFYYDFFCLEFTFAGLSVMF